jgi:AcrR family transcriptional regulator
VVADLPIAEPSLGALTERADAARNRKRILEATAALVADRGIEHVSMQDVAEAACVGTGTLYRRFGDRARAWRSRCSTSRRASCRTR